MQDHKIKKRIILVFCITLILCISGIHILFNFQRNEAQLNARFTAEETLNKAETLINRYLESANLYKSIIESDGKLTNEQFNLLSRYLKTNNTVVEAYELAPKGVVKNIYPIKGNEQAQGLDMLSLPERRVDARLARDTGNYTIGGPYELNQGGKGVIIFDPIYKTKDGKKEFWGFSILVLNWDSFLKELQIENLVDNGYHFDVWKKDENDNKLNVMNCGHNHLKNTTRTSKSLSNETWYFDIVARDGWIPSMLKIVALIASLLLGLLTTYTYYNALVKKYHEEEYARRLAEVAKEAQEANRAKTRFLFNMSHDIRTPMNAIVGYNMLMKNKITDPQLLDYQKKIEQAGDLLLSLINNVLDMARVESGKVELDEGYHHVGSIIEEVCEVFDVEAHNKEIELTYNVDVEHKDVLCDKTKVKEILMNLVSNSIKYTLNGGKVCVYAKELPSEDDEHVTLKIDVKDNGLGMSKDFIPKIFDSFEREQNSTTSKIVGTGLGMPIVKRLVDIMHGTIEVQSELNVGTTVTIIVTFKKTQKIEPKEITQTYKDEEINAIVENKHILLVEDNDLNAEIAATILSDLGIVVDRVDDGVECVDTIKSKPSSTYDLILMDIQMPNMNGYEATQAIRQLEDDSKANIPIVAMTANAFVEDKKKAMECGMNAHLSKPIDINKIKQTLVSILTKK